jgi:hypothetical protein
MDAAAAMGGSVEGYQWSYSYPDRPFPPHEALADVVFESFDSDLLLNPEDWPDTYLVPGDHAGCGCDAIPVLISTSDAGDLLDTVTVDTGGLLSPDETASEG